MNNWPRMHLYPLRLTGLPVICSLRTPSTRQCILRGLRKDFAKVSREILASRGGLALQVVSGGVAWLVDRQLRAARQLHRGEQPPALVAGWVGDGDAPGGQVRQRLLDVVTHQVELVLARPVCGMHSDLGWRQLEDQPATACIDPGKSEHVTDEDAISLRVGAVENDVCSVDHVSLSLSWSSTVSLCSVLLIPASGQHPRLVTRPDVQGVDLPLVQTVIVIPG